jgi:hypothetical protein
MKEAEPLKFQVTISETRWSKIIKIAEELEIPMNVLVDVVLEDVIVRYISKSEDYKDDFKFNKRN